MQEVHVRVFFISFYATRKREVFYGARVIFKYPLACLVGRFAGHILAGGITGCVVKARIQFVGNDPLLDVL